MTDKRPNRSDRYQWMLLETTVTSEMMESFCNDESIQSRLNPFEYNENLIELEEQLKKEFWRIVNTQLTKRQKEVMRLYAEGLTQMEIAKLLNVNQSSVTKSINGNVDYKNCKDGKGNGNKIVYGGTKKKLRKLIETDGKIQDILADIAEVRSNKW